MSELTPRQSRIIGALLGVHAGDCLGATLEFRTHTAIAAEYPSGLRSIIGGGFLNWSPGHATDDTDMTRGVLLAYRDARRGHTDDVVKLAAEYFVKWLEGDWPDRVRGSRPEDIGNATAKGLQLYKRSRDPLKAGAGIGSAGNGSLMRCIPTALFQPDPALLVDESICISRVTHDDPRCTMACAAYNAIAVQLVSGASPASAVAAGEAVALELEKGGEGGPVTAAIRRAKELSIADTARYGPPGDMRGKCSGYVLETLVLAVAAVLDQRSFEDVLVDIVRVGHDTDTNGAVAGGLLGARDGVEAIPAEWRSKLQFAQEFQDIALELVKE